MKRFYWGTGLAAAALALAACSSAVEGDKNAFARAQAHFAKGDFEAARIELINAARAAPNDPQVLLLAARTNVELGEGGAADLAVQQLKQLGAKADLAPVEAEIDLLARDPKGALKTLAEAKIQSGRLFGEALVANGETDTGRKALEAAVAADPRDTKALIALGFVKFGANDLTGAQQLAEQALAIEPWRVGGHMLLARVSERKGDLKDAVAEYDAVLKANPNNAAAIFGKSDLLDDLGQKAESAALLDKGLALWPNDPMGQFLKAYQLAQAGKIEEAQEIVQRVGGGFDHDAIALAFAGDLAMKRGNPDVAIDRYNAAIRLRPELEHLKIELARAQFAAHDIRGATETLKAFDSIAPTPVEVIELRQAMSAGAKTAPQP